MGFIEGASLQGLLWFDRGLTHRVSYPWGAWNIWISECWLVPDPLFRPETLAFSGSGVIHAELAKCRANRDTNYMRPSTPRNTGKAPIRVKIEWNSMVWWNVSALSVESLRRISERDNLRLYSLHDRQCLIHNRHRWSLPILVQAQVDGLLPRPCNLVVFDYHHDCLEPAPACRERLMRVREQGLAVESILDTCDTVQSQQTHLSTLNDDWIVAGVDLGILKDIVIFGVERRPRDLERNCSVKAYDGERHRIAFAELPGSALHPPDGDLINSCRTPQQTTLREILGWSYHLDRDQYWFSDAPEPIALDFDLDCFHAEWRGHLFAWPEKLFVSEFIESMEYFGTVGLNGKRVVEGLVQQAGLITIAREPGCCGGEQESDSIFARLNHVVFNDGIAAVT